MFSNLSQDFINEFFTLLYYKKYLIGVDFTNVSHVINIINNVKKYIK